MGRAGQSDAQQPRQLFAALQIAPQPIHVVGDAGRQFERGARRGDKLFGGGGTRGGNGGFDPNVADSDAVGGRRERQSARHDTVSAAVVHDGNAQTHPRAFNASVSHNRHGGGVDAFLSDTVFGTSVQIGGRRSGFRPRERIEKLQRSLMFDQISGFFVLSAPPCGN